MKISIIIPTLNEEKYLPNLLKDIKSQNFKDYKLIVADDNSTDKTPEIAKKYKAEVVKGGLPGVGRNVGAKIATGDYLFFLDADVRLPKNFLRKVYNEMQRRKLGSATCDFRPISRLLIDKVGYKAANLFIKLSQFSDPHASGSSIFVKKEIFDKIGGFNESLRLAEDHDFVKRASKYAPFRVISSVSTKISIRRLEKEGRISLAKKLLRVEFYLAFRGQLKKDVIGYEFGNYQDKKKLEKRLAQVEKQLERIDRNYKKLDQYLKKDQLTQTYKNNLAKLKNQFYSVRKSFLNFIKNKEL